MSLSQEPAFSYLQSRFVCGVRDISKERYAGASRKHDADGQAIRTTNGAGPHNIQLFMLAPDGTVLHCLPGYWDPRDLVHEMQFVEQLYDLWSDPSVSRYEKDLLFREMHLAHVNEHPRQMSFRSRMQGFDQKYEAKHRPHTSDTVRDPHLLLASYSPRGPLPQAAFKTTDQIVHERMAARPFVPFDRFDVERYVDYGRPFYDKHEDQRDLSGRRVSFEKGDKMIGNVPQRRGNGGGKYVRYLRQRGVQTFLRQGLNAALR